MSATVLQLPGTAHPAPAERTTLNLSPEELVEASGGYRRPADQLRALHERGFTRAFRRAGGLGPVILERSHYDAVTRGQFGQRAAVDEPQERQRVPPNRAGFKAKFGKHSRG